MLSFNKFFRKKKLHESPEFKILKDISKGSILINDILLTGDPDKLKSEGIRNVQDENVQKLDIIANNIFLDLFKKNKEINGVLSEENKDIIQGNKKGDLIVAMDPLDGSSNISVNIPVGSIFSIIKKNNLNTDACENDFLKKGLEQKCAAYVLYGTATILVIAINNQVHGFTLNLREKKYYLTYPNIKTPENGNIFSINEGNINSIDSEIIEYIKFCKKLNNVGKRTHTGRFIGSLVADFHRNMMKGGIFIYPKTSDKPNGQLRLIYECNPIALIAKFSGSQSYDGHKLILEKKPNKIHERTAFIVGSKNMVNKLLSFYTK